MDQSRNLQDTAQHQTLNITVMALCGYMMFSPVWFPPIAPRMYDNARVLELLLLTLLVPLSLFPPVRDAIVCSWAGLNRIARGCVVALLAGGLISSAFSGAPQFGMQQIGLIALLIWLFLCVCVLVRRLGKHAEIVLAAAISTGAGLVVMRFWVTFIQGLEIGRDFSWASPFLEFANVRFFGQYQAYTLLLLTLPVALTTLSLSWRIIVYVIAANFWALQWMVGSRAVWAGFLAAMISLALFMRKGRLRWLGEQGALALAGGAIYLAFSSLVLSTPNATPIPAIHSVVERGGESASARITLAKSALRLIAEHPLVGVGPGQFGLHYSATSAAHPHNTPLQLLTEYGLVAGAAGIALGAMLVVFAVRELRSRTSRNADKVAAGLTAALIMGLVDSLFSGNLIMPHSQILLCVIAGWIVGRSNLLDAGALSVPRPRITQTALVSVAVLATLTTVILTIEYLDVIRTMPYPPELRIPSFWQYGRFTAW